MAKMAEKIGKVDATRQELKLGKLILFSKIVRKKASSLCVCVCVCVCVCCEAVMEKRRELEEEIRSEFVSVAGLEGGEPDTT